LAIAADRAFVQWVALMSQAQVEFGDVAQKRANRAEVKEFAKQMIQEHRGALSYLRRVAPQETAASIPLDPAHAAMKNQLLGTKGSDFDSLFMPMMVNELTAIYSRVSGQGVASTALSAWSLEQLPTLKTQLRQAIELAKRSR
jgi:putative membrane protein